MSLESWSACVQGTWGSLWCILTEGGLVVALDTLSPDTCHALLLPQWSEDVCAAHLTQRDGYQATTQGQLKEQLYQEIIHYFDKGKVKKKKKKGVFVVVVLLSSLCTPSCSGFRNTRCLWNQTFVTGCVLEVLCMAHPLALLSGNPTRKPYSLPFIRALIVRTRKHKYFTSPCWREPCPF